MSETGSNMGKELASAARDFAHAEEALQRVIEDLIKVQSREKSLIGASKALEEVRETLVAASLGLGEISRKNVETLKEFMRLVDILQKSELGTVAAELENFKNLLNSYGIDLVKNLEEIDKKSRENSSEIKNEIWSLKTSQRETSDRLSNSLMEELKFFENRQTDQFKRIESKLSNVLSSIWAIGILIIVVIAIANPMQT